MTCRSVRTTDVSGAHRHGFTPWLVISILSVLAAFSSVSRADSPAPPPPQDTKPAKDLKAVLSANSKESKDRLLWSDVHYFREWHIQKNAVTHEFRLVDPQDKPLVHGSLETCQLRLAKIRQELRLAPMKGEAVILVHGLVRSLSRMLAAREALQKAGYENVFVFDYASNQIDIPTAAESLQQVVQSLDGIDKIHFVAHSMGGIVVRQWMAKHPDPRVGRLVMLGTPNHGAELSDRFRKYTAFHIVFGPAAAQLATPAPADSDTPDQTDASKSRPQVPATASFMAELPAPTCEFAIITGSGGGEGYNPLIPGDDDGIVSVASTRLPGARDSVTVRCVHARLTRDPTVLESVVRFLKEGRLQKDRPPVPIPALPAKPAAASKTPAVLPPAVPQN